MDFGDPVLPDRFWAKVYPCPITGCWFWGAAQHSTLPYGIWRVAGRNERAHVSSFLAAGGVLSPDKPNALHSCDQAACVRPEHLRAGTQAENVDDARRRGRLPVGTNSRLSADQVVDLRQRYADGERVAVLEREFGISSGGISLIVRGLHWASVGGPITVNRPKRGHANPARDRQTCTHGHALTAENVRWKPNPSCRSGFERLCVECRRRSSRAMAAKRKAARAAMRERDAA